MVEKSPMRHWLYERMKENKYIRSFKWEPRCSIIFASMQVVAFWCDLKYTYAQVDL